MGLGGYLTWTTVAEEIKKASNNPHIKFLPIEQHGSLIKLIKSEVFDHNENFVNSYDASNLILPLVLNNPAANYCKKDEPTRAIHRSDAHIIEQCCEVYGIRNPTLRCYFQLTKEEKSAVDQIVKDKIKTDRFLTIEPISKNNYTVNRNYDFNKWQNIVDELSKDFIIVQLGTGEKVLNNVINLTGQTTFITAAGIIGRSSLFLSTEGGLVHAATAFDTKSLVILTGYQSQKMVAYPQNINVNISNHGPCGLKKECLQCKQDIENHDWKEIVKKVKENIK